MCGIFCEYITYKDGAKPLNTDKDEFRKNQREQCLQMTKKIRHRGPDWSGIYCKYGGEDIIMTHERLSIVDPHGGSQPLVYKFSQKDISPNGHDSDDSNNTYELVLCVNGEIYNHKELRKKYLDFPYKTNSDCEVILAMYKYYMLERTKTSQLTFNKYIQELDGQFSFILYDGFYEQLIVARDPIGITPLYIGMVHIGDERVEDPYLDSLYENNVRQIIMFSSELKAMNKYIDVQMVEPGYYMTFNDGKLYEHKPYYNDGKLGKWLDMKGKLKEDLTDYLSSLHSGDLSNYDPDPELSEEVKIVVENSNAKTKQIMYELVEKLTNAVKKRLMSDVPFGLLLSGGLDSSIVCAIAKRLASEDNSLVWGKGNRFHTFSIGLEGAPDLQEAQKVADYLNTNHTEFTFTVQEGLDAVRDVIWHLETYDITTIRASVPMYLLARKIKAMGIKMVLSGEGSDELLGGYLYFLSAPSDEEFHSECCKRVSQLGHFDCLRANKTTMAWGVEGRVPFLDKEVIDLCMKIHPKLKYGGNRKIEKWVLRRAFELVGEESGNEYLPKDILWRQKEQFSDGVGYSWIDSLKELCENKYTEAEFNSLVAQIDFNKPANKEALYYRIIFDELYPGKEGCVELWKPKTEWDGVVADPSGRAQTVHENTTRK